MGKLIETYRGVIYPWQCDHQGHLNTAQYVGIFDSAFFGITSRPCASPTPISAVPTGPSFQALAAPLLEAADAVQQGLQGHRHMHHLAEAVADLLGGERPLVGPQLGEDDFHEDLVMGEGAGVVAEMVGEDGESELLRAAPLIAPFESAGRILPEIDPLFEGDAIDRDRTAVGRPHGSVDFHAPRLRGWRRAVNRPAAVNVRLT